MSLGERIYMLRTAKNLSQGELANLLDVSRQSVSKWETDASVPELDKLIKLGEIFGVSLDELVLERKQPEQVAAAEPKVIYVERAEKTATRKIVGTVLLCFAALVCLLVSLFGDILAGFILAMPFTACGLICLLVKKHTGLWCSWVIYLFADIYLRCATGINRSYILFSQMYMPAMTIHLIIAWSLVAAFIALTGITALRMKTAYPISLRKESIGAAVFWGIYLLTGLLYQQIRLLILPQINDRPNILAFSFLSSLSGWLRDMVLVVALVLTVRLVTALGEKRKNNPA